MGVVKLSKSEITDYEKYSSMLAGNPAFIPTDFDLLETQILSSSVSSVTFTGLGSYSDYKHLQLRLTARSDWSSAFSNDINMTFNGITTSSYAWHWLYGDGSAVYSGASTSQARIQVKDTVPSASSTSNAFGVGIVDILDFSNTSKNTTTRQLSGSVLADETKIVLGSGFLNNTAAVTSIGLASSNGNFIAGSRFSLYGIKG